MTELHVCTHDWPTTGKPLNPAVVLRVLAGFDEYYPAAVASLAATTVPDAPAVDVQQRAAGERSER